ncbi:Os06g0273300 [Oryza sativa Japonica Group]|uniref:Os06g0273300 protein n=1 Tax=Oryza sativa subsp. japonica TaxID=39947 RepID=A0A0P0WVJ3_ORYSJ|nr:hypothetical protein EE612_033292 [Oryza sativa]BAS97208.1 Os06g0273300 [Oryza sativa Japonica Group]
MYKPNPNFPIFYPILFSPTQPSLSTTTCASSGGGQATASAAKERAMLSVAKSRAAAATKVRVTAVTTTMVQATASATKVWAATTAKELVVMASSTARGMANRVGVDMRFIRSGGGAISGISPHLVATSSLFAVGGAGPRSPTGPLWGLGRVMFPT